jgi:membrane protein DedA with SNARE-associated domain
MQRFKLLIWPFVWVALTFLSVEVMTTLVNMKDTFMNYVGFLLLPVTIWTVLKVFDSADSFIKSFKNEKSN